MYFVKRNILKNLITRNFEGEYYHEGGVCMRIIFDGDVFYDLRLMDGVIERVYIGYPDGGRIKYATSENRSEGNNKYEYIRFSMDYENRLLVGYWGYKYGKDGVRLRTKEITRSDLEFLSYYIGIWDGTEYPNTKAKCKIYMKDGHLYFQDMIRNTSCELHLSVGKKLFGDLQIRNRRILKKFELHFFNFIDQSNTPTKLTRIQYHISTFLSDHNSRSMNIASCDSWQDRRINNPEILNAMYPLIPDRLQPSGQHPFLQEPAVW